MSVHAELWAAAEAAAADRHTMDDLGVPSPVLMERASLCVAAEIVELCAGAELPVVVLVGPGNNGGDGLAVSRILAGWGRRVAVVLATDKRNAAAQQQLELVRAHGVHVHDRLPAAPPAHAVWVDALLGTGSSGAPRGGIADALAWVAGRRGPKVAVDVPSGVDVDSGSVNGPAFVAECTVTFVRSKVGLHVTPGRNHAGRVVVADIGITAAPGSKSTVRLTDPQRVAATVAALPAGAHKGQRGHVAVVGGGSGTPGAAVLAGMAAMRAGAGLVTIVTPGEDVRAQLVAHRPELMVAQWSMPIHPAATALVVGPGLTEGDPDALAKLWREDRRPALWDASALDRVPLRTTPGGPRVITPHPGEAARMLQRWAADASGWSAGRVQAGRLAAARELAGLTHAVVVLKGEGTVIAAPDGRVEISVTGGPELATAGSGDALSGLGGALLARGIDAMQAAAIAVHVHGLAGARAAARHPGAMALDIADAMGEALAPESLASPVIAFPRLRRG
jgi:NAD(P)H-hydrate epimerase